MHNHAQSKQPSCNQETRSIVCHVVFWVRMFVLLYTQLVMTSTSSKTPIIDFESKDALFIFYDLETTGMDTDSDHIIEIHMQYAVHTPTTLCKPPLSTLIHTLKPSHPKALETHGITLEMLADQPKWETVAMQILQFVSYGDNRPVILIAQNGERFDHKLLHTALGRIGLKLPKCVGFGDSFTVLNYICGFKPGRGKLSNMYAGVCPNAAVVIAHRAAGDVQMLMEIVRALDEQQRNEFYMHIAKRAGIIQKLDVNPFSGDVCVSDEAIAEALARVKRA